MKILVTGGAGFVGSNYIDYVTKNHPNDKIVTIDNLTYAGDKDRLKEFKKNKNVKFIKGDIGNERLINKTLKKHGIDAIVHTAAETHVDYSISNPQAFVKANVKGILNLLEAARNNKINKFVNLSTDEVYGSLGPKGSFTENSNYKPNNPYSASKAAGDMFVRASNETHGTNFQTLHSVNIYGPKQSPDKLIPLFINKLMNKEQLTVHGDGKNVREWIHVDDVSRALHTVLRNGKKGETYNISSRVEKNNLDITKTLLKFFGFKDEKSMNEQIKYVNDRPGNDRRYSIDPTKIEKELDWKPLISFEDGIKNTVDWYKKNTEWVNKINKKVSKTYKKLIFKL